MGKRIELDINGSFEGPDGNGDWWRKTHTGQEFGNMFVPVGWTAYWREDDHVPWDPSNDVGFIRPEMKVIPFEPPYVEPVPRVHSGHYALQYFTTYAIHDAGIYQQISTKPGDSIKLSAWVHGWASQSGDASEGSVQSGDLSDQLQFRLGIDPTGGTDPWADTVEWTFAKTSYDTYREISLTKTAQGDTATVFLRSTVKYPLLNNDAYWDGVRVVLEREADTCKPRQGWKVKRGLVVPSEPGQKPPLPVWLDFCERAYEKGVGYATWSVDEAMYGPNVPDVGFYLGFTDEDDWDVEAIKAFRDEHYPGAEYLGRINLGEQQQPEPEPGIVPEDQRLPFRTRNPIGLHYHKLTDGMKAYVQSPSPPGVIKSINAGNLARLSRAIPERQRARVLRVLRKHVSDDAAWVLASDKRKSARDFLDLYSAKIGEVVQNVDFVSSEEAFFDLCGPLPLVLESVNEVIGTNSPVTPHAVEFDVELMKLTEERYEGVAVAGIQIIPIGNPAFPELDKLLPAIRYACNARPKHLIGHHQGYWGTLEQGKTYSGTVPAKDRIVQAGAWYWELADNGTWQHKQGDPPDPEALGDLDVSYTSGLERFWPWLAGRWMVQWDYYASNYGLYFESYAGEGGALTCYDDAGPGELGGKPGWREAGSWDDFIMPQIEHYTSRINVWNERHGNLFYGLSYFTQHWWGWTSFWVQDPQLATLREWSEGL